MQCYRAVQVEALPVALSILHKDSRFHEAYNPSDRLSRRVRGTSAVSLLRKSSGDRTCGWVDHLGDTSIVLPLTILEALASNPSSRYVHG